MATLRRAVVLLSGGLDSATALAIAKAEGFAPYALSFDYGQRQRIELQAAQRVAASIGVIEHRILEIDLRGRSALTGETLVPKDRSEAEMRGGIPTTYVPARNTVFLAHALSWAEILGAFDLFIGVNAIDYSGYPDCRPAFVAAFEALANLATSAAVEGRGRFTVHTPLIALRKAQIIQHGTALGVDYALTHSCYDPVGDAACGRCDACQLRRQGFEAAGVNDPTVYAGQRPRQEVG